MAFDADKISISILDISDGVVDLESGINFFILGAEKLIVNDNMLDHSCFVLCEPEQGMRGFLHFNYQCESLECVHGFFNYCHTIFDNMKNAIAAFFIGVGALRSGDLKGGEIILVYGLWKNGKDLEKDVRVSRVIREDGVVKSLIRNDNEFTVNDFVEGKMEV